MRDVGGLDHVTVNRVHPYLLFHRRPSAFIGGSNRVSICVYSRAFAAIPNP